MNPVLLESAARAAHEANRAWCLAHGDTSQMPWDDAPGWLQDSIRKGVIGVANGNGPRESHQSWLDEKAETGWTYGPVKDVAAKEHPCFLPYDALPPEQKAKDTIFVSVVESFLRAGGVWVEAPSKPSSEALRAAEVLADRDPDDVTLRSLVNDLRAVEQLDLTTTEAWVAAALQIFGHVEADPNPHLGYFPAPEPGFIFLNGLGRAQSFRHFPTKAGAATDLLCRLAAVSP